MIDGSLSNVPARGDIAFSRRRSYIRFLVLHHLVENADLNPAAIARNLQMDLPAVLGALWGLGGRYAPSRSLLSMGLVRIVDDSSRPPDMPRVFVISARGLLDLELARVADKPLLFLEDICAFLEEETGIKRS